MGVCWGSDGDYNLSYVKVMNELHFCQVAAPAGGAELWALLSWRWR